MLQCLAASSTSTSYYSLSFRSQLFVVAQYAHAGLKLKLMTGQCELEEID